VFRAGVWWHLEPDIWTPKPRDEFEIYSFKTARDLAEWCLRYGNWIRRIDWLEETHDAVAT
jgi:hypothetical protein